MKTKTYKLTEEEIELIVERELPAESFFQDGEGIVSNLSCKECDTFVLTYIPED